MRPITPLIFATFLGALLLSAPAHAQLGPGGAPIGWAADFVQAVDSENLILLQGRVNVRQGEARLAADEMKIFLNPVDAGQVDRIEAAGSVVYVTPEQTARGDSGVYVAAEDRILLTGSVRLIRGQDVFCSSELVIQPSINKIEATGGGASSGDPLCGGRVRGVISQTTVQDQASADDGTSPSEGAESVAAAADGGEQL